MSCHLLSPRVHISRELERKQSWDSNPDTAMGHAGVPRTHTSALLLCGMRAPGPHLTERDPRPRGGLQGSAVPDSAMWGVGKHSCPPLGEVHILPASSRTHLCSSCMPSGGGSLYTSLPCPAPATQPSHRARGPRRSQGSSRSLAAAWGCQLLYGVPAGLGGGQGSQRREWKGQLVLVAPVLEIYAWVKTLSLTCTISTAPRHVRFAIWGTDINLPFQSPLPHPC